MPQTLVSSRVPVDLSILEFDPGAGEELFLSYTHGREHGPHIRRTGKGPPAMERIGGQGGQDITHSFAMRAGAWLIEERMRTAELELAKKELAKAREHQIDPQDIQVLQETADELDSGSGQPFPSHTAHFKRAYSGHEIIGLQGCGDLTMNFWNVALINDRLAHAPGTLVHLHNEPLGSRTYSCLVKWKSDRGPGRVTIEEVQLQRNVRPGNENERVWVRFGASWLPRANRIDFAVSSQQVIRQGKVVSVVTTCDQFSDLRHLIQMPKLNPSGPLYPTETPNAEGRYRPRTYFNEPQYEDLWLGEEALLADRTKNLLRAALSGPVFLKFPPGPGEQALCGALRLAGYREVPSDLDILTPGTWRLALRDSDVAEGQEKGFEVYFKRNTYGWTMIGLTAENRKILTLACRGIPGKSGYTLEEAAQRLCEAGAYNALLIDEGQDVFQMMADEHGALTQGIPPERRRVRAIFIFGRRSPEAPAEASAAQRLPGAPEGQRP